MTRTVGHRDARSSCTLPATWRRFAWGFDGQKFSDVTPLRLNYGERVRIVLVNDTMMTHPIHLHGMWSDLEDDQGNFLLRKHTVDMPPGSAQLSSARRCAG